MDEGAYRLYAIDPGWLDPHDRELSVAIQTPGEFRVRDLLSGEAVAVQGGRFRMDVPAGSLRICEAVRVYDRAPPNSVCGVLGRLSGTACKSCTWHPYRRSSSAFV